LDHRRVLAHAEIVVGAPHGDRLGSIAAEAARVGIAALRSQDVDEHAIAALVVKALNRGFEDAVVVQGELSFWPLTPDPAQFHCERLAICRQSVRTSPIPNRASIA